MEDLILQMVKDSLGMKSNARDDRIKAIIDGIIMELTDEKGILLEETNACHLLLVTDYANWRFEHPSEDLPRNLQYRIHNLMIHSSRAVEL